MQGRDDYIEEAVTDSRQGWAPPPLGLGKGLRTSIQSSSGKLIIKR